MHMQIACTYHDRLDDEDNEEEEKDEDGGGSDLII